MLRLVERLLGECEVYRRGQPVLTAGYELSLYQDWTAEGAHMVPGGYQVDGHLLAAPDALEPLMGTEACLTLHLDDGRRFDGYLLNPEGSVTSADLRGLYRE